MFLIFEHIFDFFYLLISKITFKKTIIISLNIIQMNVEFIFKR